MFLHVVQTTTVCEGERNITFWNLFVKVKGLDKIEMVFIKYYPLYIQYLVVIDIHKYGKQKTIF